MAISPHSRLGRYEIRSQLGAGGMGEVYLARDPKINRDVAIKVLPADFSSDPERLRRFELEVEATGKLNHPNILAVYDVETHDGSPFVVCELLEGETLRERLRSGALSARKAVDYALQIAHGLTAAHEKGIIHRDLKPENIFITNDSRVKILDFGLAKLTEAAPNTEGQTDVLTRKVNTNPGAVMGTAGYMSPEQVRAQRIDHRSDIFSLGVILYEMLSGKRAFHGDSAIETLNAILKEDPPELSESHSQINPALERVVMHCLEKRPEQRFQSANDVAFALEALSGLSSSRILTEALPVTVGRRLKRERLAWVIFSGILLLSTVIFAVLYFTQGQSTGEHAVLASILPPEGSENLSSVALSPDGTRLAFIAEGRLWVRNINVGEDRSIEGTERAGFPLWSPDSSSIGFFTSDGKLKKVEVRGGPVQTLCDAPRGRGGTWNRDGVILFTPDTRDPIHKVSASGGTPEQVTHFDASHTYLTHRWPHFLPDGRHFLFFLRAAGADAAKVTGVYVGSLDSEDTKLLINNASNPVYTSPGYLLFVREGNLMAQPFDAKRLQVTGEPQAIAQGVAYNRNWDVADFSASQNGLLAYKPGAEVQSQLTWFDRSGKQVGTIGERGYYRSPAISPDGQRVAVDRFDPIKEEGDVWLLEISRNNATRFTLKPEANLIPIWSPDGDKIVLQSQRNGPADIYQKSVSTGAEEELLKSNDYKSASSWSSDGRFLAYSVIDPKTGWDIWILPVIGERKLFPFVNTVFNENAAQFSPDGHWIAYVSSESGPLEIYVQSFPGQGGKRQISNGGALLPRWSRDGRELFYQTADRKKLMAVEVKPGPTFQTGAIKTLFELPVRINGYDVTANGQRFLINMPVGQERSPSLTLIANWMANLKK